MLKSRAIKPIPLVWVFFFGALLGATKGFVTAGLMHLWLYPDWQWQELAKRTLNAAMIGFLIVPSVNLVGSLLARFKTERASWIYTLARDRQASNSLVGLVPSESLTMMRDFIAESQERLDELSFAEANEVAQTIRGLANNELRPLSHRLWRNASDRVVDYSLEDMLRVSVRHYLFRTYLVSAVYFVTMLPLSIQYLGLWEGLSFAAICTMVVSVAIWLGKLIHARTGELGIRRFGLVFSVILVGLALTHWAFHHDGHFAHTVIPLTINSLWVIQLLLVFAFGAAATQSHWEIQRNLNSLHKGQREQLRIISGLVRLANRELAEYLHSDVQNAMVQAALRVSGPNESLTSEVLKKEITELKNYLDSIEESFINRGSESLKVELDKLARLWAGIVQIDFDAAELDLVDSLLPSQHQDSESVSKLCAEAIANASRHGYATKVTLGCNVRNDKLYIEVTDNGLGPTRKSKSGIGSEVFSEITGGHWSLSAAPNGGARLLLEVKL